MMISVKELSIETAVKRNKLVMSPKGQTEATKILSQENKPIHNLVDSVVCPRCVDEVYALGISLQNYMCNLYLELADLNKGKANPYTNLVLEQLKIKKEIENLAKDNLNKLLAYFYDNGGPIIESPVSEQAAEQIQPYINKVVSTFNNQIDFLANRAFQGNFAASDLDGQLSECIKLMYSAMSSQFRIGAMQEAFSDLVSLREGM
jgi:hypothetical protein